MNRLARKGLVSAMVAGGVLACTGHAQADATAAGEAAHSPGVLSGNAVQVPVHVPLNVCGNTVNVVGLLNAVAGNACANGPAGGSGSAASGRSGSSGTAKAPGHPDTTAAGGSRQQAGAAADGPGGGAVAVGGTHDSPGVVSGNGLQLPLDLPVNITGNAVDAVGVGNPAVGNTSVNAENPAPPAHTPVPAPPARALSPVEPAGSAAPTLAHTGAGGVGAAAAGSLALLLGGTVLHRRARSARR